jgi:hypothetical protein
MEEVKPSVAPKTLIDEPPRYHSAELATKKPVVSQNAFVSEYWDREAILPLLFELAVLGAFWFLKLPSLIYLSNLQPVTIARDICLLASLCLALLLARKFGVGFGGILQGFGFFSAGLVAGNFLLSAFQPFSLFPLILSITFIICSVSPKKQAARVVRTISIVILLLYLSMFAFFSYFGGPV